ncbi:hypothetical protein MRY82_01495 [bacterium]|nr:hypothetical protein [bacterium]
MKDVFFGKIDVLARRHGKPHIEHLIFEHEGKSHTHKTYESFFVIAGKGKVVNGELL